MSLKSNKLRANITILFIVIILFINIAALWSDYIQIHFLPVAFADELSAQLSMYLFLIPLCIMIINIFLFTITSIMFILWFKRAYSNLHSCMNTLKYDNVWASSSWFIPFFNLYRPYEIMREMYTVIICIFIENDVENTPKLPCQIVKIWWGMFLISAFLGRFIFFISFYVETISETRAVLSFSMFVGILEIILCVVTIKLIRYYSLAEKRLISLPESLITSIH